MIPLQRAVLRKVIPSITSCRRGVRRKRGSGELISTQQQSSSLPHHESDFVLLFPATARSDASPPRPERFPDEQQQQEVLLRFCRMCFPEHAFGEGRDDIDECRPTSSFQQSCETSPPPPPTPPPMPCPSHVPITPLHDLDVLSIPQSTLPALSLAVQPLLAIERDPRKISEYSRRLKYLLNEVVQQFGHDEPETDHRTQHEAFSEFLLWCAGHCPASVTRDIITKMFQIYRSVHCILELCSLFHRLVLSLKASQFIHATTTTSSAGLHPILNSLLYFKMYITFPTRRESNVPKREQWTMTIKNFLFALDEQPVWTRIVDNMKEVLFVALFHTTVKEEGWSRMIDLVNALAFEIGPCESTDKSNRLNLKAQNAHLAAHLTPHVALRLLLCLLPDVCALRLMKIRGSWLAVRGLLDLAGLVADAVGFDEYLLNTLTRVDPSEGSAITRDSPKHQNSTRWPDQDSTAGQEQNLVHLIERLKISAPLISPSRSARQFARYCTTRIVVNCFRDVERHVSTANLAVQWCYRFSRSIFRHLPLLQVLMEFATSKTNLLPELRDAVRFAWNCGCGAKNPGNFSHCPKCSSSQGLASLLYQCPQCNALSTSLCYCTHCAAPHPRHTSAQSQQHLLCFSCDAFYPMTSERDVTGRVPTHSCPQCAFPSPFDQWDCPDCPPDHAHRSNLDPFCAVCGARPKHSLSPSPLRLFICSSCSVSSYATAGLGVSWDPHLPLTTKREEQTARVHGDVLSVLRHGIHGSVPSPRVALNTCMSCSRRGSSTQNNNSNNNMSRRRPDYHIPAFKLEECNTISYFRWTCGCGARNSPFQYACRRCSSPSRANQDQQHEPHTVNMVETKVAPKQREQEFAVGPSRVSPQPLAALSQRAFQCVYCHRYNTFPFFQVKRRMNLDSRTLRVIPFEVHCTHCFELHPRDEHLLSPGLASCAQCHESFPFRHHTTSAGVDALGSITERTLKRTLLCPRCSPLSSGQTVTGVQETYDATISRKEREHLGGLLGRNPSSSTQFTNDLRHDLPWLCHACGEVNPSETESGQSQEYCRRCHVPRPRLCEFDPYNWWTCTTCSASMNAGISTVLPRNAPQSRGFYCFQCFALHPFLRTLSELTDEICLWKCPTCCTLRYSWESSCKRCNVETILRSRWMLPDSETWRGGSDKGTTQTPVQRFGTEREKSSTYVCETLTRSLEIETDHTVPPIDPPPCPVVPPQLCDDPTKATRSVDADLLIFRYPPPYRCPHCSQFAHPKSAEQCNHCNAPRPEPFCSRCNKAHSTLFCHAHQDDEFLLQLEEELLRDLSIPRAAPHDLQGVQSKGGEQYSRAALTTFSAQGEHSLEEANSQESLKRTSVEVYAKDILEKLISAAAVEATSEEISSIMSTAQLESNIQQLAFVHF